MDDYNYFLETVFTIQQFYHLVKYTKLTHFYMLL